MAIDAECSSIGRSRGAGERALEDGALPGVCIMAGCALHLSGKQWNGAIAVNGSSRSSSHDADVGCRGGIRVGEIDRVLLGQISNRMIFGHKVRAFWYGGAEIGLHLSLIP